MTIVVSQATPGIVWPNPASIVYGTPLSSAQLDATASVPGAFAYSPAAGAVLGAGTDTLSVTFTPADAADYASTTATTTIAVAQATPVIAWPNPAGIVYGTPLSSAQLDATASVPGTFAYTPAAGTVLGAGTNTLSVTFTPADSVDYQGASATTTIDVLPGTGATFLGQDGTTNGNWVGTYGQDGTQIAGYAAALPSYASASFSANAAPSNWSTGTTDARAPQNPANPAGSRVAQCWYNTSGTGFSIDLNLTDGRVHDLALYFLDWKHIGRVEQVQISDAASGKVLDTETVSSFSQGVYLNYAISGHVVIKIASLVSYNAVLTGLFFGPAS
jgi:hypothetical protein